MDAMQIGKAQRGSSLLNEGRLLGHSVHAAHVHPRATDGEHHAGQAAARAHVEQVHGRRGQPGLRDMAAQWGHGSQTVEQVVREHLLRVAHGREVIDLVPLLQQRQKFQELCELHITELQRQCLGTGAQALRQHIAHAGTSPSARAKP